jgi:Tfp pilus assembly protein PilO
MTADMRALKTYWRKLSRRERIIIWITVLTALSWPLYQLAYGMMESRVKSLAVRAAATEKDILDITAQLADLRVRGDAIKAGAAPAGRRWDLVDQKGVVLFLEDMSGEARRLGVSLVAVHPSQEVEKEQYKEVSMSVDIRGKYRELAEYFRRIENLPTVVNIRKIRIESCPDTASVCAAQMEAVTYLAK